jgi:hypothetical protein
MGGRHAQDSHTTAVLVYLYFGGLSSVHVKGRCMVTVARFQIEVFADLIGVCAIAANDTLRT